MVAEGLRMVQEDYQPALHLGGLHRTQSDEMREDSPKQWTLRFEQYVLMTRRHGDTKTKQSLPFLHGI
jgi:hypothetical protein